MSVPLKPVELTESTLAARMALTSPGQVTWVDLSRREGCTDCRFYQANVVTKGANKGFGRCALVKAHTKALGKPFWGPGARACARFEASK